MKNLIGKYLVKLGKVMIVLSFIYGIVISIYILTTSYGVSNPLMQLRSNPFIIFYMPIYDAIYNSNLTTLLFSYGGVITGFLIFSVGDNLKCLGSRVFPT